MSFGGISCEGCDGRCEPIFDAYVEGVSLETMLADDPNMQLAQITADIDATTDEASVRLEQSPLITMALNLSERLDATGCTLDQYGRLARTIIVEAQRNIANSLYEEMQQTPTPVILSPWPPPEVPFSDRRGQIEFERSRYIIGRGWNPNHLRRKQRLEIWEYLGKLGLAE